MMDWSRGGEEESLRVNILPFCFSLTSATGKLKLIHLGAESGICPSVRPSVHPPFQPVSSHFLPSPVGTFQVPACERLKKSGKHVDCFTGKGAESKELQSANQKSSPSVQEASTWW